MTVAYDAAAAELAAIAGALGDDSLAAAFGRCAELRAERLLVADAEAPSWLLETMPGAERVSLTGLGAAPERALRADWLVVALDAATTLTAEPLERVQWLRRCRQPRATIVALSTDRVLDAKDMARLQRRAWRTALATPPAGDGANLLAEYRILAVDGDREQIAAQRELLAQWLAEPAPADLGDRMALLPLIVRLEENIGRFEADLKAQGDPLDEAALGPLRQRVAARLDSARHEIETTIVKEARAAGQQIEADVAQAALGKPKLEAFGAMLARASAEVDSRVRRRICAVETDLKEAIADDFGALTPELAARARDRISALALFAGIAPVVPELQAAEPALAADHGARPRWDRLLALSLLLAICLLPTPSQALLPLGLVAASVGWRYAPSTRSCQGRADERARGYEELAGLVRGQIREDLERLREQLDRLRLEASDEVNKAADDLLEVDSRNAAAGRLAAMKKRIDEIRRVVSP